jgi:hypothetical protein
MCRKSTCVLLLLTVMFCVAIMSCKKDVDPATPYISVSDTTTAVNEDAGSLTITLTLSEIASTDITIDYSLAGNAVLNGDYEVDSASPVKIVAGTTKATIKVSIFDDKVIEFDKTIEINLSSTNNVQFKDSKVEITINDNETDRSADGLQSDLSWDAGQLVNLQLYVANNVVITDNVITDFDLISGSENEKGFESVFIENSASDGEYYVVVYYESGSRAVKYELGWNSPSFTDITNDTLDANDVDYAVFWGPITKNGSSYAKLVPDPGIFNSQNIQPYIYRGRLRKK